jgi:hypothetical protein
MSRAPWNPPRFTAFAIQMKSLHVCAVVLLGGLIGCRWMFTRDRAHEEHRFATGELLTCDSWQEEGFQSRVGRTMQCWIEMPGSWTKEDLKETWLSAGESQPDGPNMISASRRLELHRSGESAALLMDNALLYKRPDLHNPAIGWMTWHISDDRWTKVFLRATLSAAREETERAASGAKNRLQQSAKKAGSEGAGNQLPAGGGKPPQPWARYEIAEVELLSLRVVAELRPGSGGADGLPAKLVFRPRKLSPEINLNVEETMAANPGLKLPGFPPEVVFELKVAETVEGKTRILRRVILEALPEYQTETQDYRDPDGTMTHLDYSLKPGFRIGDDLVFYARGFAVLDPDPIEAKLGEWHSAGGIGWPTMEKHSGTMYVRCIRRGEVSPPEEVPVVKQP